MRALIACEYSGVVREAFRKRGHEAWSCDLLPADDDSKFHLQHDIFYVLECEPDWDIMIAHPPCTHLTNAGARWMKDKPNEVEAALDFFRRLLEAPIPRVCIENPIGISSTRIRRPDQIIQPWQFGHPTTKTTGLWWRGLNPLVPTDIVEPEWKYFANGKRMSKWYYETSLAPHDQRGHIRSRTFQGIADAMASQWG